MRRLFVGLAVAAFVVVNLSNALHKGGDFDVFLLAGDRLLNGTALYEGSSSGYGVIAPPAHALLFAPFALVAHASATSARIAWYLLNLACLFAGAWWWLQAIRAATPDETAANDTRVYWLSLLAIALPAQTNFEHQNMNALLLALTGAAAWSLVRGREITGGALVGLAAALKAFPALLILYVAVRGSRRAAAAAGVLAAALTLAPGVLSGTIPAWQPITDWLVVASEPYWPARPQNQSIIATAMRLFPRSSREIAGVVVVGLLSTLAWIARHPKRPPPSRIGVELAVVVVVAALISPIAWDHYWVLALPAFAALLISAPDARWATIVFWTSAVLVTGPAPALVGARGLAFARLSSTYTLAGLLLVGALAAVLVRRSRSQPELGPLTTT